MKVDHKLLIMIHNCLMKDDYFASNSLMLDWKMMMHMWLSLSLTKNLAGMLMIH